MKQSVHSLILSGKSRFYHQLDLAYSIKLKNNNVIEIIQDDGLNVNNMMIRLLQELTTIKNTK